MPSAPSTAPYFVETYAALLEALRLDGAAQTATASVHPQVQLALQEARAYMLASLGPARAAEIQAIPYDPNGTSDASIQRQMARVVEIKLVERNLLPRFRIFFAQGVAAAPEAWNNEAFLSQDAEALRRRLNDLKIEADQLLTFLAPPQALSDYDDPSLNFATIGPAADAYVSYPGHTVYPPPVNVFDLLFPTAE